MSTGFRQAGQKALHRSRVLYDVMDVSSAFRVAGPKADAVMMGIAGLAIASGVFVGFSLALTGGGGSILATPLLLYLVGLSPPHVAIGTGAAAVCANAFINLLSHARAGTVLWKSASIFALVGSFAALVGSIIGKAVAGNRLLLLFGVLMIAVGLLMLLPRRGSKAAEPSSPSPLLLGMVAVGVGLLAGLFGIGGGFLIVPGLVFATGMPMINAIGSSLLAVASFGVTTALSYAASGLVNWAVAAEFIVGGTIGGLVGLKLAMNLAEYKGVLNRVFAAFIFIVAAYMIYRSI
jgi:uncharacterized protein